MKLFHLLLVVILSTSAVARRHPAPKFFPATHGSILRENVVANALGYARVDDRRDLNSLVHIGVLVPLTGLSVARRLPADRRYALPSTVAYMQGLDDLFAARFRKHLVVTSAIRPIEVQRRLIRRNRNAAPYKGANASSHERGTTVDIGRKLSKIEYRWLILRLMYDKALSRVLVIEESHCIHIFVGGLWA